MRIVAGDEPDLVVVHLDSVAEFDEIKEQGARRAEYVRALYSSLVGRLMPIRVKIVVPTPASAMLPGARKVAEQMGAEGGQLVVFGRVSHPEMDGFVLDAEMLPALARGGEERAIARRMLEERR